MRCNGSWRLGLLVAVMAAGCDCGDPPGEGDLDGSTRPRDADSTTPRGDGGDSEGDCGEIAAVVRDFDASHSDFEAEIPGLVEGLVVSTLDDERKPIYAHGDRRMGAIESSDSFHQWYRTIDGVNLEFDIMLPLTAIGGGRYVFDNAFFFPVDGRGFGNSGTDHEGDERNFHFTTEIHTAFVYEGGETFTFRGDDDLWLFIDGNLAIDLGGVHGAMERTVDLDSLGLDPGGRYRMDIFHAERHTHASNFRIETTIECFVDPGLI
jgi:fibro-slime domain-containing protein